MMGNKEERCKMAENKIRMGCSVSPEIRAYIEEQCEFYGMSIGAYISMLVVQSREQKDSIKAMQNVQVLINELAEIKEKKEND